MNIHHTQSRLLTLTEWKRAEPKTHPELAGLTLSEAARGQAEQWRQKRWLNVWETRDGIRIEAFSFAGTVRIATTDGAGLTVDIRPKLAPSTAATFIRYALGLEVERHDSSGVPWQRHGLVELLAQLLLIEVDEVLHRGLLHDYRPQEAWLSAPRGQVQFASLARQPLPTRVAVPCRFAERRADVPLNRLALAALRHVVPRVTESRLRMALNARAATLETMCSAVPFDGTLLQAAQTTFDRRSSHYKGVLRLAHLLWQAIAPGLSEGTRDELPGFLFNMNLLFERFVARLCREWAPLGWTVEAQETTRHAYRYLTNPHRWSRPELRPDLVVRHVDGSVLVLDTKYKDLEGQRPSAEDLYQLTLYSMAFGQEQCAPTRLIYPTAQRRAAEPSSEPSLEFTGFTGGKVFAQIHMVGLPLEACADALQRRDRRKLKGLVSLLLGEESGRSLINV